MTPLTQIIREYAYESPADSVNSTLAEHVAIGARINDWRELNKRIEFLTMIAARITFLSVLKNERIKLTLVGDKFVSEPREIDPEIRQWIVSNRAAIRAELEAANETEANV